MVARTAAWNPGSTDVPPRLPCLDRLACADEGDRIAVPRCRLLGLKPTCRLNARTSHFDPERTSPFARVLVRTSRSSHQWRVAYQRSIGFLAAGPTPRGRSELFRQAAPLKSLPNRDLNW